MRRGTGGAAGLRSIRNQVALLGGQFTIGAVPTGEVYVGIPIPTFLPEAPIASSG